MSDVNSGLSEEVEVREGRRWPSTLGGLELARQSIEETFRSARTPAVRAMLLSQIREVEAKMEELRGR